MSSAPINSHRHWAEQEFGLAQLIDKWLNQRLVKIACAFAQQPSASIPQATGKAAQRQSRLIAEKESQKWLQSYRQTADFQAQAPPLATVVVGDREADLFALSPRPIRRLYRVSTAFTISSPSFTSFTSFRKVKKNLCVMISSRRERA